VEIVHYLRLKIHIVSETESVSLLQVGRGRENLLQWSVEKVLVLCHWTVRLPISTSNLKTETH